VIAILPDQLDKRSGTTICNGRSPDYKDCQYPNTTTEPEDLPQAVIQEETCYLKDLHFAFTVILIVRLYQFFLLIRAHINEFLFLRSLVLVGIIHNNCSNIAGKIQSVKATSFLLNDIEGH